MQIFEVMRPGIYGLLMAVAVGRLGLAQAPPAAPAATGAAIHFELSTLPFKVENGATAAHNAPESMPGGVAVFDYNGDGRPDIFFTNWANIASLKTDEPKDRNRLVRNDGHGKFTDGTDAAWRA